MAQTIVTKYSIIYYEFLHAPQQSPLFDTQHEAIQWAQDNVAFGVLWHLAQSKQAVPGPLPPRAGP